MKLEDWSIEVDDSIIKFTVISAKRESITIKMKVYQAGQLGTDLHDSIFKAKLAKLKRTSHDR